MNRIVASVWAVAALACGYFGLSILLAPKSDSSGLAGALGFFAASAYCAWQGLREWKDLVAAQARAGATSAESRNPAPMRGAPGAWRGGPVPLEVQIEALKKAGVALAPGRTIEELLTSWSRAEYESDPYGLILFMMGSEVEAEPWGRVFCERGWNFDAECLESAGDYARAFEHIVRITGRPQLVTEMSDDFRFGAERCEIKYKIGGRPCVLSAKIDNDWVDPQAASAFIRDIETTIADGRRFWAADNGQASVLFFLTPDEAWKVNQLRDGVLQPYVQD